MSRLAPVLMLLFAAMPAVRAAEVAPPVDVAAAAAAARAHAEQTLSEARTRILAERTAEAAVLRQAAGRVQAARVRLRAGETGRDAAAAELAVRARASAAGAVSARQLADRAVVAARAGTVAATGPRERAAAAVAALIAHIAALTASTVPRLADEPAIARDGRIVTLPVWRFGNARALALGDGDDRGLLTRSDDGRRWRISGAELSGDAASALVAARSGAATTVPLDVDGTVATARAHAHGVAAWLAAGRFFIWPILALFAVGCAIVVERAVVLARLRIDRKRLAEVAAALDAGRVADAQSALAGDRGPLARVIGAGIAALGRGWSARESALDQALLAETPRIERGLALLAVLAGVAPLLGLLGTVTGMIDLFGAIADRGSGDARSLSGAVSEALVTTQAGMLAAIPLLIAHVILARAAERRMTALEEAACAALGIDAAPAAGAPQ